MPKNKPNIDKIRIYSELAMRSHEQTMEYINLLKRELEGFRFDCDRVHATFGVEVVGVEPSYWDWKGKASIDITLLPYRADGLPFQTRWGRKIYRYANLECLDFSSATPPH